MQPHVRTNEVEKEDESRDSRISRVKRVESTFGFVPCFELPVKRFDEVVRNVIVEVLNANVVGFGEETFNGHVVC